MDRRRLVLAGLAVAAAGPAFAQTTQPAPVQASPTPMTDPKGAAGRAAGSMGDAEMRHMQRTMAAGAASLETSRIALQKAEDEDVKGFAQFEVREQEGIADILKSIQDPSTVSGAMKPPSQQEAMAQLDAKGQDMVKKMQQAKGGDGFDRDYVKGQLQGHRELLEIQQDYLKSGRNLEHVTLAKLASAHIQDHITLLEQLDEGLR